MFKCSKCGRSGGADEHPTTIRPGDKPARIVVERRVKSYPVRTEEGGFRPRVVDNGGAGWEIAKEILLCSACATGV